ncbi:MAG: hypothetical protein LBI42_04595 [Chitinispirillales bacterium]|nr:hypothetical protein [Chitinispirillales bacterium]
MMRIPFPSDLLSIEKWKAFKGKYPPNSTIDHRIIIIYKNDGIVKYFYVTSKVENARRIAKYDIGSLVDGLNNNDWNVLTVESCIQCNKKHLYDICENELRRAYENGGIEVLGEVPEKIKSAIIFAVCASESFTDTEKKIYTV